MPTNMEAILMLRRVSRNCKMNIRRSLMNKKELSIMKSTKWSMINWSEKRQKITQDLAKREDAHKQLTTKIKFSMWSTREICSNEVERRDYQDLLKKGGVHLNSTMVLLVGQRMPYKQSFSPPSFKFSSAHCDQSTTFNFAKSYQHPPSNVS